MIIKETYDTATAGAGAAVAVGAAALAGALKNMATTFLRFICTNNRYAQN